jgi:hypothetical protein
LRKVADEVGNVARASDLLGRLGGDELGILLHECDRDGAIQVAEKINRRLAEIKYPGPGSESSCFCQHRHRGFFRGQDGCRATAGQCRHRDVSGEEEGWRGWHLYSEGEGVHEEDAEPPALEGDDQPVADRWRADGLIISRSSISVLARSVTTKRWCACGQPTGRRFRLASSWRWPKTRADPGDRSQRDPPGVRPDARIVLPRGKHYKFSINLSGVSINDPRLLAFIRDELSRSPLLPGHVVFEITETAAVSDFSAARTFMNAVRELGCAFSLDDFGVGYSSFNYVKQLPVDYVKIDGSFVRTLVDSPDDQVFVRKRWPRWRGVSARRRWRNSSKMNVP